MPRRPKNVSEILLAAEPAPRVGALYALIARTAEGEVIIARRTIVGRIPWLTDDPEKALTMAEAARAEEHQGVIEVATFARVEDVREIRRHGSQ
jgi:hypothetical protein